MDITVFGIVLYDRDTYSYRGMLESETVLFTTRALAEEFAASKGLTIREDAEHPNHDCELKVLTLNSSVNASMD